MLYALNQLNQKIPANPKTSGNCPYCKTELIPKCGSINIPHWAHKSVLNCDSWYEPETDWHRKWKNKFPKEQTEVVLSLMGKKHIADYFNADTMSTVEFQNSSISIEERIERESFYPNLSWIFNVNTENIVEWDCEDWIDAIYWWKHPKKSLLYGMSPKCHYYIDNFPQKGEMFYIKEFKKEKYFERNDFGTHVGYRHLIRGCSLPPEHFIEASLNCGGLYWWN